MYLGCITKFCHIRRMHVFNGKSAVELEKMALCHTWHT